MEKKSRRVRTGQINVTDPALHKDLKDMSESLNTPISQLVRDAIVWHFDHLRATHPKLKSAA